MLILILVLISHISFAIEVKDIMVRNVSTEHGLSHHTVNAIWQDEHGFMWIGTLDGLNRFDGRHFKVFKPDINDPHSITENNIRQICGDGDGHLYIRGLSSLIEYDMKTRRFRFLKDNVKEIYFAEGSLWMSDTKVISVYDREQNRFEEKFYFSDKDLADVIISGFAIGKGGCLYIRTISDGLFVVNEKGNIIRHLNIPGVKSVLEDRKGNVWIATMTSGVHGLMRDGKLLHYQYEGEEKKYEAYNNVRSLCEDNDGNIWLSTYGGLIEINVTTGEMIHYSYEFEYEAFNVRSISPIFYDRQGTLWLGSFHNGVSLYNPDAEKFNYYKAKLGDLDGKLNSPIVSSFDEDGQNQIFIGTEGGWVNVLDRKKGIFNRLPAPQSLYDKVAKSLLYDRREKVLYVSTLYGGVTRIRVDEDKFSIYPEQQNAKDVGNIVSMLEWSRDSLLLATNSGLKVYDKRNCQISSVNTGFQSRYHKQVWDIEIDDHRNIWFTTSSNLYCYDMKNDITRCYVFSDVVSDAVNNHFNQILKDSRGRLWFGSSGSGFFLYNQETDTFRRFCEDDGLPSGFITAICEDSRSSIIYVATNKGLVSYDSEKDILRSCDISNNFPSKSIRNMFISEDGELFLSDLEGMVSVDCSDLESQFRDYDVFVSGILVDNVTMLPGSDAVRPSIKEDVLYIDKIKLSPRHSSLSFEITNTDYLNTFDRVVEYKLEGFDTDFISTSCLHPITYTNLPPGRYELVVRGLVPSTSGEYPHSEIIVYVDKPFYLTAWFLLLVVIVVGIIALYLFRVYALSVRLRSLNSANESKMRFFTNISHEFRTPLTLINGQLEMLLQQGNLKPSVYSKILSVYRNSTIMNNLVSEIVDMMKSEAGKLKLKVQRRDIVAFLREIYVAFEEYARQRNINISFESDCEDEIIEFDSRQLEKVFFNLLSNAFKYTPAGGDIKIRVKKEQDGVSVGIWDNGKGISPEHINHVFEMFYQDDKLNASLPGLGSGIGLALSKAIVEMHGGRINVESTNESGTCFTVRLKYSPVFSEDVLVVDDKISDGVQMELAEYKHDAVVKCEMDGCKKGVKMLIVEDSNDIMELLVSVFSHKYDILTASCGEEGLSIARKECPDIIVSDVMMPGISGIEMCRILKEDIETCHIPIVLLTAYALENYVIEGLSMGADDYVTKPFNVKILVARCDNLVLGRKRLQEKYQNLPETSVAILSNNTKDKTLLEKAVSIVMEHIDDPNFKIDVFAHELGLSRTYLFSKLKGLTGQSPNEFITTIRLKEAVVRLVNSKEESISDIAYSLGFSSSSYFINCFKARYGKTPAQYRKEFS